MVIHALDTPYLSRPSAELRRQTDRDRQLSLAKSIGSVIEEMHRMKIRQEQEKSLQVEEALKVSGGLALKDQVLVM